MKTKYFKSFGKFGHYLFILTLCFIIISCTEPKTSKELIISTDILAATRIGDAWGFIDKDGQVIIDHKFSFADNFSDGVACISYGGFRPENSDVLFGGQYDILNVNGNEISVGAARPFHFYNERALIEADNNKIIIDRSGKVISDEFEQALPYSEDLAAVVRHGNTQFLDKSGSVSLHFSEPLVVDGFQDGLARARKSMLVGFINKNGEWAIEAQFENAQSFSEGMASYQEEGLFGFINKNGEKIIQAKYENVSKFSEGLAAAKLDGKWGYIDKLGNWKIKNQFENVRDFSEDKAAVMKRNKVGYIGKDGAYIIRPKYEAAYDFKNDRAIVQIKGKMGYLDESGNLVIDAIYDRANNFVNINESNPLLRIN